MDKKSRLKEELRLLQASEDFSEYVETNSLQVKADNKIKPYKKVDAIIIPDNATNGDMIKLLFPDTKTWEVQRDDIHCAYISFKDICGIISFPLSWWNAPFKKESGQS